MQMAGLESMAMVVEEVKPAEKPVDREKTCPLLLRVFCSTGRHNSPGDYARGSVPQNELQIYTWMDATLRELTGLVKEVNPETRPAVMHRQHCFAAVSPPPPRQTSGVASAAAVIIPGAPPQTAKHGHPYSESARQAALLLAAEFGILP